MRVAAPLALHNSMTEVSTPETRETTRLIPVPTAALVPERLTADQMAVESMVASTEGKTPV